MMLLFIFTSLPPKISFSFGFLYTVGPSDSDLDLADGWNSADSESRELHVYSVLASHSRLLRTSDFICVSVKE